MCDICIPLQVRVVEMKTVMSEMKKSIQWNGFSRNLAIAEEMFYEVEDIAIETI